MSTRSANLAVLKQAADRLKRTVAPVAIRAGLNVLESGLKRRCPANPKLHIAETIHQTRIGVSDRAAGGGVIVDSPLAESVEFGNRLHRPYPFVAITRAQDGPRAIGVMSQTLLERLS